MNYSLRIKQSAERAISRLSKPDKVRIDLRVQALAENPRPPGAIPLHGGGKGLWRTRVGEWRIVYQIRDGDRTVLIVDVAHRREVYRGL